jgi:hypothetical protein
MLPACRPGRSPRNGDRRRLGSRRLRRAGTIAKSLAAWHPNRLGDPKLMAVTPPPAALAFTPSPFDFGQVGTGQTSSPQTFTLANTGGQATGALTDTLTGAAAFTVTGDTCTGISLAAGGTCTVTVRFAPASMATDTATLTAASANPAVTATDTLTGTGVRPRFLYWTDQIGSGSGTISVIPLTGVGTPPPWSPGSPPRPGWRLTPAISTGPPPPRGSPRP